MKKVDDKGFIAISIIYSFFILFIAIMLLIMYSYISDRKAANRIKSDIVNEFSSSAPKISIDPTGSDNKKDSYIVSIKVADRGNGISSINYIWSTSQTDTPNISIENNSVITSPTESGKYFLIVKACDLDNNCQILISNRFVVG